MIIIDTSVAFKWFDSSEENNEQAIEILKKHLLGKQEIIIPDLLLYELSNAWTTKSALRVNDIKENLEILKKYSLTIVPIDFTMLLKAVEFSKQHTTSVYDAIYAMLARERKCTLITADEKFIIQTKQEYIIHLKNIPL